MQYLADGIRGRGYGVGGGETTSEARPRVQWPARTATTLRPTHVRPWVLWPTRPHPSNRHRICSPCCAISIRTAPPLRPTHVRSLSAVAAPVPTPPTLSAVAAPVPTPPTGKGAVRLAARDRPRRLKSGRGRARPRRPALHAGKRHARAATCIFSLLGAAGQRAGDYLPRRQNLHAVFELCAK